MFWYKIENSREEFVGRYRPEFGFNNPSTLPYKYAPIRVKLRECDSVSSWNKNPKPDEVVVPPNTTVGCQPFTNADKWRRRPGETLSIYQKRMYDSSPHVRFIREHYKISPEHPGVKVLGEDSWEPNSYYDPWRIKSPLGVGFLTRLGPTYFDKPEGEGCLGKVWAISKLGFVSGVFALIADYFFFREPRGYKEIMSRFVTLTKYPTVVGATYAATACVATFKTNEDNWKNHAFAGFAAGTAVSLMTNRLAHMFFWGTILAVFGTAFKIVQQSEAPAMLMMPQKSQGYPTPMWWREVRWEPFRREVTHTPFR